jgi:hypothetical protein
MLLSEAISNILKLVYLGGIFNYRSCNILKNIKLKKKGGNKRTK